MQRKCFMLSMFLIIFLFFFALLPISTEANTSANNLRVMLVLENGDEKEAEIIEPANGKEIQIIGVGGNARETVLCEDLDKILEPQTRKIVKKGFYGALIGAGVGSLVGGIGAIPGALYGFLFGSGYSTVETGFKKDIKSRYCY